MDCHILIVDDDKEYSMALKNCLDEVGRVDVTHSESGFRSVFAPYKYDLILLDLRLREGKEGLDLLDFIIEEDPLSTVIVISGYGDIATAVEALQKGAKTFLEKNRIEPHEIRLRVEHALKENLAERRIRLLESSQEVEIIGDDPKIQKIRELTELVAQDGETTVLIRGETGTGKDLVARAIHRAGTRNQGPFVAVSLSDHPDTISSELFGHERGAFTGATARHYGYFEQAHKGILFLDEIGELPWEMQVKLLRVIDQKTVRRMGGKEDFHVDVQVITATNRPLEDMLKAKSFREDLYYRLKVFEIHLPPLRERKGDIPALAEYFLYLLRKRGRTPAKRMTGEAMRAILEYDWPGNIRELKSSIESAALRCRLDDGTRITKEYLQPFLLNTGALPVSPDSDVFEKLAEMELRMVEDALLRSGGAKSQAWKLLGYPDRFSMLRRVKRILKKYPILSGIFPEIKKRYLMPEAEQLAVRSVD